MEQIPREINVNGFNYVRNEEEEEEYVMRLSKDGNCNLEVLINHDTIMTINDEDAILNWPIAFLLKKWAENGYKCDAKAVEWNGLRFFLNEGLLLSIVMIDDLPCIVYDFVDMTPGSFLDDPLPTWKHTGTLKVL